MAETGESGSINTMCQEQEGSHSDIYLRTESIKAQTNIEKKWRQETARCKEMCDQVSIDNSKLPMKIEQARLETISLHKAHDVIKQVNVDLEKEMLLVKENILELSEQEKIAEKKYEAMWLAAKARYESSSFMQKLLKIKQEKQNIKQEINELENEENRIRKEIINKMKTCAENDRKRIIEFAEFMVIERPKSINYIKVKSAALNEKIKEMESLKSEIQGDNSKPGNDTIMPKLQLRYSHDDNLNTNLDKTKGDKQFTNTPGNYNVDSVLVIPTKRKKQETPHTEKFYSPFFYKPAQHEDNNSTNKLINILDDIKIGKDELQKIIEEVNPVVLHVVDSISVDTHQNIEKNSGILNTKNLKIAEIEEMDMPASDTQNIIMPPTQFLDMSTQSRVDSQKEENNMPNNVETNAINVADKRDNEGEIDVNVTSNNELEVSDDIIDNMKDMATKINNLDKSPQFVYAKNIMTSLLQKPEDAVVTSKFFPQEQNQKNTEVESEVIRMEIEEDEPMTAGPSAATEVPATPLEYDIEPVKLIIDDCKKHLKGDVSNTKNQKAPELTQGEKFFGGSLFGQSVQMTSDSTNESPFTTGFENDDDFPSYLDTSLLLSPKPDLSMPNIELQEVLSDEVPNIYTELRKDGFSLFGFRSSEPKPESSDQNQKASGFNFNFGGDKKKTRRGLFSMFKGDEKKTPCGLFSMFKGDEKKTLCGLFSMFKGDEKKTPCGLFSMFK